MCARPFLLSCHAAVVSSAVAAHASRLCRAYFNRTTFFVSLVASEVSLTK